jgi:hypothetical protein
MPAKSKAQQRLMGLAYANPEVRQQIGIKKSDARKLAKTKHKGMPEKVTEDYLQELWDLYEMNVMEKPPLQPDTNQSAIGTPTQGGQEHPVIQQRRQVDDLRAQGMSDVEAHQQVYGEVDLANPESKAQLASTLHRIQTDDQKRGVKVDKDATFKSLFAREKEAEENNDVTPEDMKTPMSQEVPDELEIQQEEWYNFDVNYLQTYGRA